MQRLDFALISFGRRDWGTFFWLIDLLDASVGRLSFIFNEAVEDSSLKLLILFSAAFSIDDLTNVFPQIHPILSNLFYNNNFVKLSITPSLYARTVFLRPLQAILCIYLSLQLELQSPEACLLVPDSPRAK